VRQSPPVGMDAGPLQPAPSASFPAYLPIPSMPEPRFEIRCGSNSESFSLRNGCEEPLKFPTLAEALSHAQNLAPNGDARLVVFNAHGAIIIESFV